MESRFVSHAVRPGDPRLDVYRALAERRTPTDLIVVEGRIAVERALVCGWRPRSIAGTQTKLAALADAVPTGTPVFELSSAALRELVGFDFHRGCLAAFDRPPVASEPSEALIASLRAKGRSTIVVAQGLADPTNLGAVARTARGLGAALLVADAAGADPFERRAIRSSMGHVLCLPVVCSPNLLETLGVLRRALQAHIVAASARAGARGLQPGRPADHVVVLVGNEGAGLPDELSRAADEEVTIEMAPDVDSLNVATALGVILWAMR